MFARTFLALMAALLLGCNKPQDAPEASAESPEGYVTQAEYDRQWEHMQLLREQLASAEEHAKQLQEENERLKSELKAPDAVNSGNESEAVDPDNPFGTTLRQPHPTRPKSSSGFVEFQAAFATLNRSVESQTGIRLFASAKDMGDGIIHVTATPAWLSSSYKDRMSSLNTIFKLWEAAEGSGLPIAVYITDTRGEIEMKKAGP